MKKSQQPRVKCFMLHETDRAWQYMRRYQTAHENGCKGQHGDGTPTYHEARYLLGVVAGFTKDAEGIWQSPKDQPVMANTDPRWPTKCDHCSYEFKDSDARQIFDEHIFVTDDGREMALRTAPPGAMWFADWLGDEYRGPDGHVLSVRCPDGRDWIIDSPASNCTMKHDRGPYGKAHRCWVRHGTPPLITVDKNGKTCGAGAGSIDTKHKYHGFLGCNGAAPGEFT